MSASRGTEGITGIGNSDAGGGADGLELRFEGLARGVKGSVSLQTFIDPKPLGLSETSYFEVLASPTIYGTQTLTATIRTSDGTVPELRFFVVYYDGSGLLTKIVGDAMALHDGETTLRWLVPDTRGLPIQRVGIELASETRMSGKLIVRWMDCSGAPAAFVMGSAYDLSPTITPFDISSYWLKAFVSSALHFRPGVDTTFALSHPEDNGVATIGTRDWHDYSVPPRLTMDLHESAGLVARARGHRRYYAALMTRQVAKIVCRIDGEEEVPAQLPFGYAENQKLVFELTVEDDRIGFQIDGDEVLCARDRRLRSGAAGMVISRGTVPVLGFEVRATG